MLAASAQSAFRQDVPGVAGTFSPCVFTGRPGRMGCSVGSRSLSASSPAGAVGMGGGKLSVWEPQPIQHPPQT